MQRTTMTDRWDAIETIAAVRSGTVWDAYGTNGLFFGEKKPTFLVGDFV